MFKTRTPPPPCPENATYSPLCKAYPFPQRAPWFPSLYLDFHLSCLYLYHNGVLGSPFPPHAHECLVVMDGTRVIPAALTQSMEPDTERLPQSVVE